MFKSVALAVLLSVCFTLSECQGPGPDAELDPVIELSNYLEKTVGSDDTQHNYWALRRLNSGNEMDDKPKAKELLSMLSKLLSDSNKRFCDGRNLKNLFRVSEIVFGHEINSPENLRLKTYVRKNVESAWELCLRPIETEFRGTGEKLSQNYGLLYEIRSIFWALGQKRDAEFSDSLTYLLGAMENKRSKGFKSDIIFEIALRSNLDKMFCKEQGVSHDPMPCAFKIDEMTGEDAELTQKEAEDALDRYILEPCSSFMKDKGVENFLKPVAHLGQAILNTNPSHKLGDENKYKTLEWVPIVLICQWFIDAGKHGIAYQLMISSKKRASTLADVNHADFIVNSYLVDHVKSNWNFNDNIMAIRYLQSTESPQDPRLKYETTMNLIQLISKLKLFGDEDLCDKDNLKNLRDLIEALVREEKDSFRSQLRRRRLNYLLYKYTENAQKTCLDKLESVFATTQLSEYQILEKLDGVCLINLDNWANYQLRHLIGALSLPEKVQTSRKSWTFWTYQTPSLFEEKLMSVLNDTRQAFEETTNEVGSNEDTGKPKSLTFEQAQAYLNENFFDKCQSLLDNESIKEIVEQVVDLGVAINNVMDHQIWEKDYLALKWVPRYLECKWFYARGLDTFATLLSKKTEER